MPFYFKVPAARCRTLSAIILFQPQIFAATGDGTADAEELINGMPSLDFTFAVDGAPTLSSS